MSAKQLDKQLDFDKDFLKEEAMTIDLDDLEDRAKHQLEGPCTGMAHEVLELIAELRAKNDLLEEIFDACGDKNGGECPVCHLHTHKHWCWYPHLAKMLGKPLDGHDERFFALDNALRTAAKNKTD